MRSTLHINYFENRKRNFCPEKKNLQNSSYSLSKFFLSYIRDLLKFIYQERIRMK